MSRTKNISIATAITFAYALGFIETAHAELPLPYLQVCLDFGANSPTTDEQSNFQNICNNIVSQSNADDNDSVAALRHEEVAAQGTSALESSRRHTSNINARIVNIRHNILGGGSSADDENELLESSRWGFFTNGNFNRGDRTQTVGVSGAGELGDASKEVVQGERAFDFDGKDLSLGVDYRFPGEKMILGTALGLNQQSSDFTTQAGSTDLKSQHISFFGTYLLSDKVYFDGMVSFGKSDIDASRPIPVFESNPNPGSDPISIDGLAFSDTDAQQISISVGAGYEFNKGAFNITPYSRFDYSKTKIDSYTETVQDNGGSSSTRDSRGMAISVAEQRINSLVGTLGIKTSYPISSTSGVFVPQASVELKHQFRNDDRFIEATLPVAIGRSNVTADPNTQTSEIDRDYIRLGLGVSAVFPKGRSGFLLIESLQGSDDLSDTAIKAGFRLEF